MLGIIKFTHLLLCFFQKLMTAYIIRRRVLDSLSKEVSSEYEEEEIYDYGNLLVARTGYGSSRAEDLLTMKKEN